jgi:Tfp pilus assembly protein PilO
VSTLSANKLRLGLAVAGLNLVLVAAGWFLLVSPQRHHQQSASQQLQQVQLESLRLVGGTATQPAHAKQQTIHTSNLYRLAQAMPPSADEADLLLALNHLAKASGVKVLGITLGAPTAEVGDVILPAQLTLDGSYGSLTRYLHTLRMLVGMRHGRLFAAGRFLSVSSVGMTPDGKGRTETATVSVNAYVFGSVDGVLPLSATSTNSTSTTDTTTTTGG